MKESILLKKCCKCGLTKYELEKEGLSLYRMPAFISIGGAELVIEICNECLKKAGLAPID